MPVHFRPGPLVLRARRSLIDAACWTVSRRLDFDPSENLYVFSDPRGGSTWLTEAVAEVPRTAVLWEPLHINKTTAWDGMGLGWRPDLPEDVEWGAGRDRFDEVFRGRRLDVWTRGSSIRAFLQADRLVVKICRGNALLPWLTRQFRFSYAPVFLVRHPLAVASSQLSWGAWDYDFKGFDVSAFKPGSAQEEHADVLSTIRTKEEALVARWCLSTWRTLRHPRSGTDWISVHYEHLLLDREREADRIFERWDLDVPEQTRSQLKTASGTTKEATFERGADVQLTKWQRQLDGGQVNRMLAVLEGFGVTEYNETPLPRARA